MNLQSIKVSACYESETNPRGTDFESAAFKDLVASVKEKGVLVPVLVRKRTSKAGEYEVIAGSRRLRAAKEAVLKEIPANVVEMSDAEAREAQIVENLQRQDIHPLDEGQAYRELIEEGKFAVKDVAIKVGKSETYVRGRLFLTNLVEPAAKAYRSGKLLDSFAVIVARLTPDAQKESLKWLAKESEYGNVVEMSDFKEFITEKFSNPLSFQPWLKDAAVAKIVGPCKECPSTREDLFGKTQDGTCTDLKCWHRKMDAFIAWKKKEVPELAFVSADYGKPNTPGALGRNSYEELSAKKDHCDFAQKALVVDGEDIGKTITICASAECKKHRAEHKDYRQTPAEREKRKKEIARERAKEQKDYDGFVATIKTKVAWPLSEKTLDILIEKQLTQEGHGSLMSVAGRLGIKAEQEKNSWGGSSNSFKPQLRTWLKAASKEDRLRLYVELVIDRDRAKAL